MTAAVPAKAAGRDVRRRVLFALAAAALVSSGLIVPLTPPVNPDISWLSYAARRYLGGGVPYVDLIEINPPAILFFNLPAAWLSDVTGWDGPVTYTLYVAAMSLVSVAATRRLLRPMFEDEGRGLDLLTVILVLVLFTLTGRNFGQREHVMLVLALPYLAAVALRMAGRPLSPPTAIGVGLLAGVGLSLKPHFLLVWLAVELLLWTNWRGRRASPFRTENVAVAAVVGAYVLAIVAVTPRFFPMADALGEAYLGYLNGGLQDHLTQPAVVFVAVAVVARRLITLRDARHGLAGVLAVAGVAALVMAAVQLKGWSYHYYPGFAVSCVLLGLLGTGGAGRIGFDAAGLARITALATLAIGVVAALASVPGIVRDSQARLERLEAVSGRIEHGCDGSPRLAVFSPDAESAFPLVTRDGFRWGMPISSLWPLSAVYEERAQSGGPLRWHDRDEAVPAERFLRGRVVEAVTSAPPDLLLVDRRASRRAFGGEGFGYVEYFGREPRFRLLFSRYRSLGDWSGYRVFADSASRACSRLVGGAGA